VGFQARVSGTLVGPSLVDSNMVRVVWKGDMVFEAEGPSGVPLKMDSSAGHGGGGNGPTPVEALLGSLAACTAMDVVSILKKKQQEISSYRIEVDGERGPEGEFPRPFVSLKVKHILSGPDLDPAAVGRSIQLSDEKYCTVMSTLRLGPTIKTEWEILQAPLASGAADQR
jgi:putative redox protein